MSEPGTQDPFAVLARYERLSQQHTLAPEDDADAAGIWRGISFRVGTRLLVSGIDEVSELLAPSPLTPVPGTRPWLLGVTNVRGNLLPVVDFSGFLFAERTRLTDRSRFLVVRQGTGGVALLVDEVFGQRTVDEAQRAAAQVEADPRLARFVDGCVGEPRLAVFSMQRLVRAPDFRQAAA